MPDFEAREAFPKILAAYMEQNNMRQADVARSVHVSKQIVSDWLHGKKFPRVDKMQELADLFGVLMSDMYTPHKAGIELNVNRKRVSFMDAVVRASVNTPETLKFSEFNAAESIPSPVFKDNQTKSMMKLWEVATPETKAAVIGVLKAMSKTRK